jgi:type II secretory pathway component GspD/PulD (secretin)
VAVTSPNRLTALMALAFALAASAPAAARDACPDPDARFATLTFDLKILKQPVAVAVDVISKQAGTTAVLDKSLARDIERLELRGSLREAMDTLSQRADLVWWWDGSSLRVADNRKKITRNITFPDAVALADEAEAVCLPTNAVQIVAPNRGDVVRVTGPRTVVNQISDLANSLRTKYENINVTRYGKSSRQKLSN